MSRKKRARDITWREARPVWMVFAIILMFGTGVVWITFPEAPVTAKAILKGDDLVLYIGELKPNVHKLFAYPLNSHQTADYFVERDADSKITIAFASCRRCYRDGYHQKSGLIVCGRCNDTMKRASADFRPETTYDCTQIPIPVETVGDRLTVRATAVRDAFTSWYGLAVIEKVNPTKGNQE